MEIWRAIHSQQDDKTLLDACGCFHDGCIHIAMTRLLRKYLKSLVLFRLRFWPSLRRAGNGVVAEQISCSRHENTSIPRTDSAYRLSMLKTLSVSGS